MITKHNVEEELTELQNFCKYITDNAYYYKFKYGSINHELDLSLNGNSIYYLFSDISDTNIYIRIHSNVKKMWNIEPLVSMAKKLSVDPDLSNTVLAALKKAFLELNKENASRQAT